MGKCRVGGLVYAKPGAPPAVGAAVDVDARTHRYAIRFSAVQQGWYAEGALAPYAQRWTYCLSAGLAGGPGRWQSPHPQNRLDKNRGGFCMRPLTPI